MPIKINLATGNSFPGSKKKIWQTAHPLKLTNYLLYLLFLVKEWFDLLGNALSCFLVEVYENIDSTLISKGKYDHRVMVVAYFPKCQTVALDALT